MIGNADRHQMRRQSSETSACLGMVSVATPHRWLVVADYEIASYFLGSENNRVRRVRDLIGAPVALTRIKDNDNE